jgi:formylglycine-generating enzyme required for sulfatase activity
LGKSKLGLYDMAGNVEEYCNDFWQCWVWYETGVDPCGPESGDQRIRRGGGWSSPGELYIRSTYRLDIVPTSALSDLGFRIARTAR